MGRDGVDQTISSNIDFLPFAWVQKTQLMHFHVKFRSKTSLAVDGRNLAPVDMENIPFFNLFTGFQRQQVVSRISSINSIFHANKHNFSLLVKTSTHWAQVIKRCLFANSSDPSVITSYRRFVWHGGWSTRSIFWSNKRNAIFCTRWFKLWPDYPLVGGHLTPEKVTWPSQKGHKEVPAS